MTRDKANEIIGDIGETIARTYVEQLGYKVTKSTYKFDSKKDFLYEKDGRVIYAEVKTQQPFVYKEMFSYRVNQLPKCTEIDELYIVSIPPLMHPTYKYGGLLFKAEPKTKPLSLSEYTTKAGVRMYGFSIKQENLNIVSKISKENVEKMLKYAYSDYK